MIRKALTPCIFLLLFVTGSLFFLSTPVLSGVYLSPDSNRFIFKGWGGPAIPVWYTLPENYNADTPIVIVMHGVKRDADRYLSEWTPLAREYGFILLVPEFSKQDFPGAAGYNLGNVFTKDGRKNPEEQWSFSALDPLFETMKKDLGSKREGYRLYGHSAGSQFVHRFLLYKPDAKIEMAISANAGWYTAPTEDEPYPYGLKDSGIDRDSLKPLFGRNVIILLGDKDTDPNHKSLRRTQEAMRQGPHRFARGHYFFEAARTMAKKLDVSFNWKLQTVPGAEHRNDQMAIAASPILSQR
ncbi:alpha/beta hydrolase [Emcibacter sp.]|uniref:alpha/beta hydrolase n=1 Tax=Emcibacter sp. TaxID=1979954 RepID=UPI003A8D46C4